MTTKFLLSALLLAVISSLMGCNTVEGFGKDTKHAGQAIENSADEHK